MTFKEVLAQVIDWLQQDERISYRALKRQFNLDDDYLEDLKDALLFAHPVVDEAERGLVWTGDSVAPVPDTRSGAEGETRFQALLPAVTGLLQRDRRLTYRTLKYILGVDDGFLQDVQKELTFRRLACDEDGEGLVWTGDTQPAVQPADAIPSPPATADTTAVTSPAAPTLSPSITEASTPSNGPTVPAETISTEALQDGAGYPGVHPQCP